MDRKKKMHLGISALGVGYHATAWRDPDVPADGGMSFPYFLEMARTAERGLFDVFFLADHSGISVNDIPKGVLGRTHSGADFEPLTLVAALSQFVKNVGFVVTASTTFYHPYHIARLFSSLDHLTDGRIGWNIVTSAADIEAQNFGYDKIPDKQERYERAREAIQVVCGLWNSFEEDAFIRDKATGVFFDAGKLHVLNHDGKYFKVKGPLNLPRPLQGRPILVQAGSSTDGIDLAATTADLVYTAQNTLEDAQRFYAAVKDRAGASGRSPDEIKIMPGILPVIGESRGEAEDRYGRMQEEMDPLVGLAQLAAYFGDLSNLPQDGPVPDLPKVTVNQQSRGEVMLRLARRNNWSIRQLYQSTTISMAHHVVLGTAQDVADAMEEWFLGEGADGFNFLPAKAPGDLKEFVDKVVPELQHRGLFRVGYEASTLRGNLGLPVPQ